MIFFYNAQGNAINVVPEPVYQGSNKANTIYVVAPFPSNVQVLAHFLLPNGEILQPAYAPNKNGLTLLDALNINDSSVGVWGVQLTKVMTAYAGTVSVQFEFISYDQEITTKTVTFPVSKGVTPSVPLDMTAETTLQEILAYVSTFFENLETIGGEMPLVANETFVLDVIHESIVVGYNASLPLSSFNKTPVQGDKFWGVCETNDDYAYSFVATITSVDNENSVVEVEFTKVVLLYDADFYINVTNKLNKLIFDGNGDKFLADDGEYKEVPILYRHYVKFTSYYGDGSIIDTGTLVILSNSQTPIDNVEELREYKGREVYVVSTFNVTKGFATIYDHFDNGSLAVTIGNITLIIYSGQSNEPTTLVDNIEIPEFDKGTTVTVDGKAVETFNADTKLDKINTAFRLYGTGNGGNQVTYAVGWSANNNVVPIYDRSNLGGYNSAGEVTTGITGAIKTAIPEKPDHATPKKWVEDLVDNKFNETNEHVDEEILDVRKVAEGKTKSFTINTLTALGGLFGIDTSVVADEYVITTTTINYKEQSIEVKQGDLFLIVDTSVPDYWVSVDDMKLYKLETTKVDLTEYVKKDQLATNTVPGLISYSSNYGVQRLGAILAPLGWEAFITQRQNAFMTYALLDKAVKAGVTTNTQTLTDEEKALAQNWLGIGSYQHQIEITATYEGQVVENNFMTISLPSSEVITLTNIFTKLKGVSMLGVSGGYLVARYVVNETNIGYEVYDGQTSQSGTLLGDNSVEWSITDIVVELQGE